MESIGWPETKWRSLRLDEALSAGSFCYTYSGRAAGDRNSHA